MKLTVIKPSYFADVSLLAKAFAADLLVWADTFLFTRHSTINRARIKTAEGPQWLTAAVYGGEGCEISKVILSGDVSHHCRTLEVTYQKTPYYFFLADQLDEILNTPYKLLNRLCKESFLFLCRNMNIGRTLVDASELPRVIDRSARVVEWLKKTGCNEYLVEEKENFLINEDEIRRYDFRVTTFAYEAPKYHQLYGEFIPNLSGLDLLFNEGEQSKYYLQKAVVLHSTVTSF